MISDEMLSQAAAKAAVLINESLPEASACNHPFSARFQRKMSRIIRRANRPVLYRALRSAASILLVMMLGFGSVLAIHTQAREIVFGWVRKQYESFFHYSFAGTSDREGSAQYYPGWVPDGHRLITVDEINGGECYVYYDENGGIATFIYSTNPTSLEMYIGCVGYEQREVTINGLYGILYISPSDRESSELIWIDDEKGTIFNVSAHVGEEELIKMAENITVNDNPKKIEYSVQNCLPSSLYRLYMIVRREVIL